MPFSWDARIEDHPVGNASLRDFAGAFSWSEQHGRRSAGSPGGATPLPPRKRSGTKTVRFGAAANGHMVTQLPQFASEGFVTS